MKIHVPGIRNGYVTDVVIEGFRLTITLQASSVQGRNARQRRANRRRRIRLTARYVLKAIKRGLGIER